MTVVKKRILAKVIEHTNGRQKNLKKWFLSEVYCGQLVIHGGVSSERWWLILVK